MSSDINQCCGSNSAALSARIGALRTLKHNPDKLLGLEHLGQYHIFGDPTGTTAILDRLLHHSEVIQIIGDNYRLLEKRREGILSCSLDVVRC